MAAPWSFDVLAFFSTEGGRRPFRHLKDTKPSVIIRTNKDLDVKNYVIQLRQAYPQFCSSIFQMSQDGKHFEPRWFFDEHDFHVQGGRFLYDVVSAIIVENQAMLNRFCKEWSEANKENSGVSHLSKRALGVEFFFHAEDRRKWGDNFLRVALDHMMAAFTAAQDQHLAGTQKTANMQGRTTSTQTPVFKGMIVPQLQNPPLAGVGAGFFAPSQSFRSGPWTHQNLPMTQVPLGTTLPSMGGPEPGSYAMQSSQPTDLPLYIVSAGGVPDISVFTYFSGQIPVSAPHMQSQFMPGGYGSDISLRGGRTISGPTIHKSENMSRGKPSHHQIFDPSHPQRSDHSTPNILGQQPQRQTNKSERGRGGRGGRGRGGARRSSIGQSLGHSDGRFLPMMDCVPGGVVEDRQWQTEKPRNYQGEMIVAGGYSPSEFSNYNPDVAIRRPQYPENHSAETMQRFSRRPSRGSFSGTLPRTRPQQPLTPQQDAMNIGPVAHQLPINPQDFHAPEVRRKEHIAIPDDCESWFELWVPVNDRITRDAFEKTISDVTAFESVQRIANTNFVSIRFHSTSDLAKVYNHVDGLYCDGLRLSFQIPAFYLGLENAYAPPATPPPEKLRRQTTSSSRKWTHTDTNVEANLPSNMIQRRQSTNRDGRPADGAVSMPQDSLPYIASPVVYSPQDARSGLSLSEETEPKSPLVSDLVLVKENAYESTNDFAASTSRSPELHLQVRGSIEPEITNTITLEPNGDSLAPNKSLSPGNVALQSADAQLGSSVKLLSEHERGRDLVEAGQRNDYAPSLAAPIMSEGTKPVVPQAKYIGPQASDLVQTPDAPELSAQPKPKVQPSNFIIDKRKKISQTPILPAIPKPLDRPLRKVQSIIAVTTAVDVAASQAPALNMTTAGATLGKILAPEQDDRVDSAKEAVNSSRSLIWAAAGCKGLSLSPPSGPSQETSTPDSSRFTSSLRLDDSLSQPIDEYASRACTITTTIRQHDSQGSDTSTVDNANSNHDMHLLSSAECEKEPTEEMSEKLPGGGNRSPNTREEQEVVSTSLASMAPIGEPHNVRKNKQKKKKKVATSISVSMTPQPLLPSTGSDNIVEESDQGASNSHGAITRPSSSTSSHTTAEPKYDTSTILKLIVASSMTLLPQDTSIPIARAAATRVNSLPQDLSPWQKDYDCTQEIIRTGAKYQQIPWKMELHKVKTELEGIQNRMREGDAKLQQNAGNANLRKTLNKKRRALVATHEQHVEQLSLLHGRIFAESQMKQSEVTTVEHTLEDDAKEEEEPQIFQLVLPPELEYPACEEASTEEMQFKADEYTKKKETLKRVWVSSPFSLDSTPRSMRNIADVLKSASSLGSVSVTSDADAPNLEIISSSTSTDESNSKPSVWSDVTAKITEEFSNPFEKESDQILQLSHNAIDAGTFHQPTGTNVILPKSQSSPRPTSPTTRREFSFPELPNKSQRATSPTPSQVSGASLLMSYAKAVKSTSPELITANFGGSVDKGKARATSVVSTDDDKHLYGDAGLGIRVGNAVGDDWKIGPEGAWGNKGLPANKDG